MNKMIRLFKICRLVGVLSIISLTNFYAHAQDYIISTQGLVIASISDKGVNRIAIENDRIAQVIGNEDEYIIESDANLGQIFLTPTLKAPQEISLRLLTERDKIIDTKFVIKKIDPQTINFKYKNEANAGIASFSSNPNSIVDGFISNQLGVNDEVQQIIENIKLVYSNKLQGIDLPILGCLKNNSKFKGIKLAKATQYNLNKRLIVKAIITNRSKEELLLNESEFSNCMKLTQAVSLDKNHLFPGNSTTVYLVGKDGR